MCAKRGTTLMSCYSKPFNKLHLNCSNARLLISLPFFVLSLSLQFPTEKKMFHFCAPFELSLLKCWMVFLFEHFLNSCIFSLCSKQTHFEASCNMFQFVRVGCFFSLLILCGSIKSIFYITILVSFFLQRMHVFFVGELEVACNKKIEMRKYQKDHTKISSAFFHAAHFNRNLSNLIFRKKSIPNIQW